MAEIWRETYGVSVQIQIRESRSLKFHTRGRRQYLWALVHLVSLVSMTMPCSDIAAGINILLDGEDERL